MSSKTILVVDDYEDLRKLVALYLCARGYDVLEAASGNAAIQSAISCNPSLILLDLRLPDMSGLAVARELRTIPTTAHIPVIGWTADFHSDARRGAGINAGLHECIHKPVSFRELEAIIDRFVPRPQN